MKKVFPDFYDRFECIADKCRHTCCVGWEIDVDDDTALFYQQNEDILGARFSDVIKKDEEGYHFILSEDERCPFLREDGLCRIIKSYGEEALCDICALHPRFYGDFGEYELCGLGLSCEAVCDLLWESDEKLSFYVEEKEFSFAQQKESFKINLSEENVKRILKAFEKTEPIDEKWTDQIGGLISDFSTVIKKAKEYAECFDKKRYDRLYCYIAYRQLEKVFYGTISEEKLSDYANDATMFVFLCDAYMSDTKECIRRFSEQIEYSTENVDIIMGL